MEKLNVAIADDNELILDSLERIIGDDEDLSLVGRARNGKDIYHLIETRRPDVVLLDLIMPYLDAIGVMERVKQNSKIVHPPVFIVLTSIGREEIARDVFQSGASYFIMKPFENDIIINRIKNCHRTVEARPDLPPERILSKEKYTSISNIKNDLSAILNDIGIPVHLSGFSYLRDAIALSVNNIDLLNSVTKILYFEVAQLHNSTNQRIERSIRHAIDVAWKQGGLGNIEEIAGCKFHTRKSKPSNTELIAFVADILRLKYKRD